ncbi:MAG TPA: hypothetical protein VNX88_22925 [Terriglobales bacterium]|jgi:hypothetical protein|nr:hypothetical protein [Terriglobales bacterium]
MKVAKAILCTSLLACPAILSAQEAASKANSQPPKTYAQKLVNDTLAKHKEVVIMAFHVTPPNQSENVIIASNIGRIGKKADEDDMRVIDTGQNNLEVNKAGNHFEDELPLLDQAGNRIGAVGIVFDYKPGVDKNKLAKQAEKVRDEMAQQIPSKEKLFEEIKE